MKEDEIIRQYGSVQEFIRETERKLLENRETRSGRAMLLL